MSKKEREICELEMVLFLLYHMLNFAVENE